MQRHLPYESGEEGKEFYESPVSTFQVVWEGILRRVRLALACRTAPSQ
jgi:hypothetical protein